MTDIAIISVTFDQQDDGEICVRSNDLPGLILSSPNKDRIVELVKPAITELLKAKGLEIVRVEPTRPFSEVVEGPMPGDVDVAICLLYTSPSPRDQRGSRMPSSA